MAQWLGPLVFTHPLRVLFAAVVVSVTCALGALQYEVSSDYRIFFAEDDPQLVALQELESEFSKTDNIVFVVKPRTGDVFAPAALDAIRDLTARAWDLPHARRVDSLTNHTHARQDAGELLIEPLVPARLDERTRAGVREAALQEPFLIGTLVAPDGGAAGVNVTLGLPDGDPVAVTDSAAAARSLVAELQTAHPSVEIRASGLALLNEAFMSASIGEIQWAVPVMAVVMIGGLVVLLQSGWATFSILLVVALASGAAVGTGGWLGYPLTPVSASAPTIIMTLCIADGVHLVLGAREMRARGLSTREALQDALSRNLKPIFLTSASTVVGFLALNFAESPPFWHMANMTAVGVTFAFVLSVTLLPALLSMRPLSTGSRADRLTPVWDRIGSFVITYRWPVLAVGALIAGLGLASANELQRDDQFVDYFEESVPWRADTGFLLEHLGGLYIVDLQIPAPNGVTDPAYLAALDELGAVLRDEPAVTHVSSVADLVKRLNEAFGGGYGIPDRKEMSAQALLAYEMSLPTGLSLHDRVAVDQSSSRLTYVVRDVRSEEIRSLAERTGSWLTDRHPELAAKAVSPVVLFANLSERNTERMMRGNLLSLMVISLGLMFALRSPKLGLLSLVPNLLPIVLAYGLWALCFERINLVGSVGAAVCLGLVVDDTIHFLSKYQDARADGLSSTRALRYTLRHVGTALLLTSVVLVAGFGVLTQSTFAVNSVFGTLVVLVVTLALLADILLLPAGLAVIDGTPEPVPQDLRKTRGAF